MGRLLQATRVRARLHQWQVGARAGTSQQWVSRVERGLVDLRLRDAERLFAAAGARLVVQIARPSEPAPRDPDLLVEAEQAEVLTNAVESLSYLWRRFADVPLVVGGRLAALLQGLPARPMRLDLIIAEPDLPAADRAMAWMNAVRWSDVNQDYTNYATDISAPGARRWRLGDGSELRVDVVPDRPAALNVTAAGRQLSVLPLVRLVQEDPDVAALAKRLAERPDPPRPG